MLRIGKYGNGIVWEWDCLGYTVQMKHVKNKVLEPTLIPASLTDYPCVQNMARFYVYDLSRYCGDILGWECPADGLYECIDFKDYFEKPDHYAFLIKIEEELAGFVLINKIGLVNTVDWNMGELFVLAKFQRHGIAKTIVQQIFATYPGRWEIGVILKNTRGQDFWRNILKPYANVTETIVLVEERKMENKYSSVIFSVDIEEI